MSSTLHNTLCIFAGIYLLQYLTLSITSVQDSKNVKASLVFWRPTNQDDEIRVQISATPSQNGIISQTLAQSSLSIPLMLLFCNNKTILDLSIDRGLQTTMIHNTYQLGVLVGESNCQQRLSIQKWPGTRRGLYLFRMQSNRSQIVGYNQSSSFFQIPLSKLYSRLPLRLFTWLRSRQPLHAELRLLPPRTTLFRRELHMARSNNLPNRTSQPTGAFARTGYLTTLVVYALLAFVILFVVIGLSCLLGYASRRLHRAHVKRRCSHRLEVATRKALKKLALRTLQPHDKEVVSGCDQCAVCIELYRASDVVRILPCRHMYHKKCIDPWLLEQRSCPLCKLDILASCGISVDHRLLLPPRDEHGMSMHRMGDASTSSSSSSSTISVTYRSPNSTRWPPSLGERLLALLLGRPYRTRRSYGPSTHDHVLHDHCAQHAYEWYCPNTHTPFHHPCPPYETDLLHAYHVSKNYDPSRMDCEPENEPPGPLLLLFLNCITFCCPIRGEDVSTNVELCPSPRSTTDRRELCDYHASVLGVSHMPRDVQLTHWSVQTLLASDYQQAPLVQPLRLHNRERADQLFGCLAKSNILAKLRSMASRSGSMEVGRKKMEPMALPKTVEEDYAMTSLMLQPSADREGVCHVSSKRQTVTESEVVVHCCPKDELPEKPKNEQTKPMASVEPITQPIEPLNAPSSDFSPEHYITSGRRLPALTPVVVTTPSGNSSEGSSEPSLVILPSTRSSAPIHAIEANPETNATFVEPGPMLMMVMSGSSPGCGGLFDIAPVSAPRSHHHISHEKRKSPPHGIYSKWSRSSHYSYRSRRSGLLRNIRIPHDFQRRRQHERPPHWSTRSHISTSKSTGRHMLRGLTSLFNFCQPPPPPPPRFSSSSKCTSDHPELWEKAGHPDLTRGHVPSEDDQLLNWEHPIAGRLPSGVIASSSAPNWLGQPPRYSPNCPICQVELTRSMAPPCYCQIPIESHCPLSRPLRHRYNTPMWHGCDIRYGAGTSKQNSIHPLHVRSFNIHARSRSGRHATQAATVHLETAGTHSDSSSSNETGNNHESTIVGAKQCGVRVTVEPPDVQYHRFPTSPNGQSIATASSASNSIQSEHESNSSCDLSLSNKTAAPSNSTHDQ